MSKLDDLVRDMPIPSWRPVAWLVMVLIAGLVVWSRFAMLDEVAVAMGEVIPQGNIKIIQHLEGGIVEEIDRFEGDTVRAGDRLIQLNLATSGVNKAELQVRLDGHLLARARLEAEALGNSDIDFPKDVAARLPTLVRAEQQAFDARQRELASTIKVLQEKVRQKDQRVKELKAKLSANEHNLKLAQERLKLSDDLVIDGLVSKLDHLKTKAEVEELLGKRRSIGPTIPEAEASAAEARERIIETRIGFRREAQETIGRLEQSIAEVQEVLARATDQKQRAEIRSPIDGIVKNTRYHTIGGVVKPGEPIMEIVPLGNNLVIEAKLAPTDRGYVREGQPAVVKISSYDFVRYGGLDGEVIQVAPDSSVDTRTNGGATFFRVVVRTDKTYLGETENALPITPGMEAIVDIHTGEKSVMEYLVKPVLKLKHEAFRER